MTDRNAQSDADNDSHSEIDALKAELRALRDTIVDGLIIIDENKKVLSFNPGAARIFGYDPAEVIGRNVKLLMPQPYHSEHDRYVDNYRASGAAKIIGIGREVTGRRKDGSTFPMYLSVGEMESGGDRHFVGVVRDLSEFKEQQELIEGIASNLPGPVFRRVQYPDGTLSFTYVSEGLRRVFGLDPARVVADSNYLLEAIHPDDREDWRNALEKATDRMAAYAHQMRITRANGQTKWMQAIARPHRQENGTIVWDGIALDITELRSAESAREASARQYQELLEAAPDAIWVSASDTIVYANPAAVAMMGATESSELIGRENLSLVSPGDRDQVARRRIGLRQGQRLNPVEIRRQRLDGRVIETETSAIGITWDGRPANLVIARDIDARKKVEAQLRQAQKMEAVGQLTGGVAHDFNNLLAVLMMDLEELAERHVGDSVTEALVREARDVARSAADLTSRLLSFSRQQDLDPREVNAREIVSDCLSLLRRTIGEHIDLDFVVSGDLWPILVDPRQFENALLNLTVNARDAMPSGGRITIEARNALLDGDYSDPIEGLGPGDYVQISVTDTGSGIPREIQHRVFDPFFTTKQVGSGTGLGLSMVYGFAKQSGGHASIYSEVGHGTTISLYLPRASSDGSQDRGRETVTAVESSGGETILLVEDFLQLRKRAARMLTDLGYSVIEAGNGDAALAALEAATKVDLLFTDIVMPGGMTGFELAETARKRRPGIKVLYTSGYAEGAGIDAGLTDTNAVRLHKPYARQDLARTIRQVLDAG